MTTEPEAIDHPLAETPIALIAGMAFNNLPHDLYIPPDALQIFLEAFAGPLDLLLYLIKKQNLDILNIPIAEITRQYMQYIELMQELKLELAAEYLLMAAVLAEIKSRLLLPRINEAGEEEDPRAELVRRLKEYEQFKQAAEDMDALPRVERDIFIAAASQVDLTVVKPLPSVDLNELIAALREVLIRADWRTPHTVMREALSVRERMTTILHKLQSADFIPFQRLFSFEEGRQGVVVTFIAVLELIKQSMIDIVQTEAYGDLHVKARVVD